MERYEGAMILRRAWLYSRLAYAAGDDWIAVQPSIVRGVNAKRGRRELNQPDWLTMREIWLLI
jgi:hypothetical protein